MEGNLIVSGLTIGGFLILLVQTIKLMGVTSETWLRLGALIGALFFGGLYLLVFFLPAAQPVVDVIVVVLSAVMTAVLGYFYAVKPLAERFDLPVSSKDVA